MKRPWQKELLLSGGLILAALVAYGHLLEPGATPYSKHSDLVAQHLAMKQVAFDNLRRGDGLPHWKNDMLSGGPALTHPQALYTHPLQGLFLVMSPTAAAGPTLLLHFVAMALSLQWLGSVLGLGFGARAFMALAGLFGFKMMVLGYSGWLPVLPGLVTAPLLFAAVLRVADRPGPRAGLGLALAGTLALHAGHLQTFYYATLLLSAYLFTCFVGWLRAGERDHALRVLGWCAAGAMLAACLSAYLLLPLAADTALTSRSDDSRSLFQSRGPYTPSKLLTLLHPEILGSPVDDSYDDVELWEDVAYFGLLPFALAVLGLAIGEKRRHWGLFAAALPVSIFLAFDTPVLWWLFDWLPGFGFFRHPSRLLFVTTLVGLPLAGIGLDVVLQKLDARRPGRRSIGIASVTVGMLCLVVFAEGFHYARRYLRTVPAVEVLPGERTRDFFGGDESEFRIAPMGRHALNYGWPAFMNVSQITGFDAYNYRHYEAYIALLTHGAKGPDTPIVWTDVNSIARLDLLDALNVKYIVAPMELAKLPDAFSLAVRLDDEPAFTFYRGLSKQALYIYRNDGVLPRFRFAGEVVTVPTGAEAGDALARVDLRRTTVVESREAGGDLAAPGPGASLKLVDRERDRILLETRNSAPGYAVISEIWHPGWRATLDGEPLPLNRTNGALLGAWLPAGEHALELEFRPLYWRAACGISAIGLVLTLGLAAIAFRRPS